MKTAAYTVIGAIISGVAVFLITSIIGLLESIDSVQKDLLVAVGNHEVRITKNESDLKAREAFLVEHIKLKEHIRNKDH